MPPPTLIQQLRRLDESSSRFPGQITKLLRGQKHKSWINNLHNGDPSKLVEYLDDVIDTLQPNTAASRTCLHVLRAVCGSWKMVPKSHVLQPSLLNVNERPVATRGPCDVHEASLNGSKVWVKKLRMYSIPGPRDVERGLCQEAVVWKRLSHPNIVPLIGVTFAPFQFVSVWYSGGDLLEFVHAHPHVNRLPLLFGVADGLNYLHSHDVIHGDLKGPSIVVDHTGLARLTDFGFSRIISDPEPAAPVAEGRAVRWASPEALHMEFPVTEASDVYSFAMVVVETYTGRVPFYDSKLTTVIIDVLSGCRPSRPADPNVTDDLWKLTEQCWSHDPQRRPRIAEVVFRLRTASASRRDCPSLDGTITTPGTFRQDGLLFEGPCLQSSHGLPSRAGGQQIDLGRETSGPSNLSQRNGGWFSRYASRFKRDRYEHINGSYMREKGGVPTADYVHSTPSLVSSFPLCR